MSKHYVYLAGPIAGLSYNGCTEWRTEVAQRLNSDAIHCLTPMRGKEALAGEEHISSGAYPTPMASQKGITRRDAFDTHRASALFVNLLGAKRVSIGTVMEIAWAWRANIPVILIRDTTTAGDLHDHVMLNEAATYIVDTLQEGVRIVKLLLEPETEVSPEGCLYMVEKEQCPVPTLPFAKIGIYRTRGCQIARVDNAHPINMYYPLSGLIEGSNVTINWTEQGKYWANDPASHEHDLVERIGDL